jgi:hypothetical protein
MDDYERYLDEKKNKSKFEMKLFEKIKPSHIVLFAALFLIGSYLVKNNNNSKWVWIAFGGLVVLFIVSLMKQSPEEKQIPRHIAQSIAQHDLEYEILPKRSFVHGTKAIPTGYFKDQTFGVGEDKKIYKYHFGFQIKEPGKPTKEIDYQMCPFTGICKGVVEIPLGFNGEDIKDTKIIVPEKIIEESSKPQPKPQNL